MMSVRGYYNGSSYVATEKAAIEKDQDVIITILDSPVKKRERKAVSSEKIDSLLSLLQGVEQSAQDIHAERLGLL